jgi:putative oxidoreductase
MLASVSLALLILRLGGGLTRTAHGAELFGWFGGPGYATVARGFDARGLRPGRVWAGLAILGEVGGGLALGLGFLTPLGAAGPLGAMFMALTTQAKNGFFFSKGGFEYPLVLLAMSLAFGVAGPGAYSLDALFRIALPEAQLFGALAVTALIVDAVGILLARSAAKPAPAGGANAT